MYKFNFLQKINEQKELETKKSKLVSFVFVGCLIASVLMLVFMYFSTTGLSTNFEAIKKSYDNYEKKYQDLQKDETYFANKEFRTVYNYYSKRIVWSDIINGILARMNENFVLESFVYNPDLLTVKFQLKTKKNESISNVLKEVNDLKDSLTTTENISRYFPDNDEDKIVLVGNPSGTEDKDIDGSLWSFSLEINLRAIEGQDRSGGATRGRRQRY